MCAKTYQLQTKAVIWTRLLFGLVVVLCCLGVFMMVCWTWGSFVYEAEAVQKSKSAPAENLGNIMLAKPSKDRRWNIVLLSDREDFMYQRSLASTAGALLTGRVLLKGRAFVSSDVDFHCAMYDADPAFVGFLPVAAVSECEVVLLAVRGSTDVYMTFWTVEDDLSVVHLTDRWPVRDIRVGGPNGPRVAAVHDLHIGGDDHGTLFLVATTLDGSRTLATMDMSTYTCGSILIITPVDVNTGMDVDMVHVSSCCTFSGTTIATGILNHSTAFAAAVYEARGGGFVLDISEGIFVEDCSITDVLSLDTFLWMLRSVCHGQMEKFLGAFLTTPQ